MRAVSAMLVGGFALSACGPSEEGDDSNEFFASGGVTATGGLDASGGSSAGGSVTSGGSTSIGGAGIGGTATGGAVQGTPVDCSPIAQHEGWALCESGDDFCAAVFSDGAGCAAVCAAVGLACAETWEDAEGSCAANKGVAALSCSAPSGHQSDYCRCAGPGGGTGGVGTGGTGGVSTGGVSTGGVSTGGVGTGGVGTGGTGGTIGADQCAPIGWATRSGRSGGSFNVTGGGNVTPIVVKTWADLEKYASDGQARVLHVDGNLGGGWSGKEGDRLEIKSNKTIIGIRPQTRINAAIHINGASNVILRNVVVRGPGSNGDQAWDNINIEGSSKNVWVDHCEFTDGQDGNADVVKGADNVTFTWTKFGYTKSGPHNFSNLVASSDDEPVSVGKLNITLMFNWFTGVAQRQPRCRYGDIHVVNNLFTRDGLQSGPSLAGEDARAATCRSDARESDFVLATLSRKPRKPPPLRALCRSGGGRRRNRQRERLTSSASSRGFRRHARASWGM